MLIKYNLLFKSGKEEEFMQKGTEEELASLHSVIYDSMMEGKNAIVTFGDGKVGRYIRVADLSQMKMELIEE